MFKVMQDRVRKIWKRATSAIDLTFKVGSEGLDLMASFNMAVMYKWR
jgi:hypothetical protein